MVNIVSSSSAAPSSLSSASIPRQELTLKSIISDRVEILERMADSGLILQAIPELGAYAVVALERISGLFLSSEEVTPPPSFATRTIEVRILLDSCQQRQILIPFNEEADRPDFRGLVGLQVDLLGARSVLLTDLSALPLANLELDSLAEENNSISKLLYAAEDLPLAMLAAKFTERPDKSIEGDEPLLSQSEIATSWLTHITQLKSLIQ